MAVLKPKMGIDKALMAKAISDNKHVIITVHGTFANAVSDSVLPDLDDTEEDRWWQIGSRFTGALQKKVKQLDGQEFTVLPFHWDGQNADSSRLKGARKLARCMNELENAGREYSVVAHSHGGNVFSKSLHICRTRFFESKPSLKNLKSYISVGVPFFKYKRKKSQIAMMLVIFIMALIWFGLSAFAIVQELKDGGALKALIATALLLGSIYIVGSVKFNLKFSVLTVFIAAIIHSMLLTPVVNDAAEYIFFAVLSFLNFGSLMLGWSLLKMIFSRFIEQIGNAANLKRIGLDKKTLSLISHRDEAMALLKNSVEPRVKLVQARTLDKRFSSILDSLGVIIIIPIFIYYLDAFTVIEINRFTDLFKLGTYAPIFEFLVEYDEIAIVLGLSAILGAAAIYFSLQVIKLIVRYSGINHLFAYWINNRTIKTLRGAAFGDDSEWKITGVSKTPDHLDKETVNLEILDHDNFGGIDEGEVLSAAGRLHGLLEQLNMDTPDKLMAIAAETAAVKTKSSTVKAKKAFFKKAPAKKDMQEQLKEAVLKMLYHNAYFRDEKVIELIAEKIVQAQAPIPET